MSGITVLVWLLYAASCVQLGSGLLMDDTVESSMTSRLDSLEKLLAEEKQLRMNVTANLNDRLNEEQRLRTNLTANAAMLNDRLNEEQRMRLNVTANQNDRLTDLNSRLNEEQRMRLNVTANQNDRLTDLNSRLNEEQRMRLNVTANQNDRLTDLNSRLNEEQRMRAELSVELEAAKQRVSQLESRPTNSGYPAFMAVLTESVDQCTLGQHVIFDDVKYNEGGAYNSHHGIFTAPVAGTYMFTSTLSAPENTTFHTALVINEFANVISYSYADRGATIWLERSTATVTHLDADDEVWMVCRSNSRIRGSFFHSYLAGTLISPDA